MSQEEQRFEGATEPQITEKEELLELSTKYKQAFELMDEDADGVVSRNQLESFLKNKIGLQITDEELENILKEMHANENGDINLNDFLDAMSKSPAASLKSDSKFFNALDADGDGMVGASDWQKILSRIGIQLSLNEVSNIMTKITIEEEKKNDDLEPENKETSDESDDHTDDPTVIVSDIDSEEEEVIKAADESKTDFVCSSDSSSESEEILKNEDVPSSCEDAEAVDDGNEN